MSTRSVRLDKEAESALEEIMARKGLSISGAIKEGLLEYRTKVANSSEKRPADFFSTFDLGSGGYAVAPAREAKQAIKKQLEKRRRQ